MSTSAPVSTVSPTPAGTPSPTATYPDAAAQRHAWTLAAAGDARTRDTVARALLREPDLAADIDAAIGASATTASVLCAWIRRVPRTESELHPLLADTRVTIAAAIAGTTGLHQSTYQRLARRGHYLILESLGTNEDVNDSTYLSALRSTRVGFAWQDHQRHALAEALARHPEAARQASVEDGTDPQIRAVIITAGLADLEQATRVWALLGAQTDTPLYDRDPVWTAWYVLASEYLGNRGVEGAACIDEMIARIREVADPDDPFLRGFTASPDMIDLLEGCIRRRGVLDACARGDTVTGVRQALRCAYTADDIELACALWSNPALNPLALEPAISLLHTRGARTVDLAAARDWNADAVGALLVYCSYEGSSQLLERAPDPPLALHYAVTGVLSAVYPPRFPPWLASEHLADAELLRLPWAVIRDNENRIGARIRRAAEAVIGTDPEAWTACAEAGTCQQSMFCPDTCDCRRTFADLLAAVAARRAG